MCSINTTIFVRMYMKFTSIECKTSKQSSKLFNLNLSNRPKCNSQFPQAKSWESHRCNVIKLTPVEPISPFPQTKRKGLHHRTKCNVNVIFDKYFKPPVTYLKVLSTVRSSKFSKIAVELLKIVSLFHHLTDTMIHMIGGWMLRCKL